MRLKAPTLAKGQVLVKVLYSGVCRSQLMEVRGKRGEDSWLPHLLGHEGSGVVVEIGPGVTKVSPGDAVILSWIKGDGLDAAGAIYSDGIRNINSGPVTTFSNFTVVAENRVVLKPESLDFDTAVLFGCALPTGAGMVLNELTITSKETVAVLGLGGIGLSAVMALVALGVKNIIAIDVSREKLEKVKGWGVRHCINSEHDDVVEKVLALTKGGADFCIEATGHISGIEDGFSMIRKFGGQLLFASHPPDGEKIRLSPHDLISGKQISGSWGGSVMLDRDIPRLHSLFSKVATPLNGLLTKRYDLNQINAALDDLEEGRVFRPLIVMTHQNNSQNPE
ncbi:hypothetical protein A3757_16065 [Oleiphilus sp. HI0117]|nr:hypothetical protein A3757_16065 [Oleiphilus sp. HI0117]